MNIDNWGDKTVREHFHKIVGQKDNAKLFGIVILVLAVSVIYFLVERNQKTEHKMDLQKFVLNDPAGHDRQIVHIKEWGPQIDLLDNKGTSRAVITLRSDKSEIIVRDFSGKLRLSLLTKNSEPLLSLFDADELPVITLSLANLGPLVDLSGIAPELRLRPVAAPSGEGLELIDSSGKKRVALSTNPDMPALVMLDDAGLKNTVINIRDKDVTVSLLDMNEKERSRLTVGESAPQVIFFDSRLRKRAELITGENQPELQLYDDMEVARTALALATTGTGVKLLDFENEPVMPEFIPLPAGEMPPSVPSEIPPLDPAAITPPTANGGELNPPIATSASNPVTP